MNVLQESLLLLQKLFILCHLKYWQQIMHVMSHNFFFFLISMAFTITLTSL